MNNSDENNLRINKKKKEEVKEDKPKQAKKVDRKKFEKQETTTRVKHNMQTRPTHHQFITDWHKTHPSFSPSTPGQAPPFFRRN
jgi:hypothetical protein